MYLRNAFVMIVALGVAACTSIQVEPVDRSINLKHVCIQENQKVMVEDFVRVIRDGFDRHGISTEVISGAIPERCEYVLTYTALRSWDFGTFLADAELRLESKGRKVAYANYHLRGKGGIKKWAGTKSKMDPVIDKLLQAY
jgi:hypothetical protein